MIQFKSLRQYNHVVDGIRFPNKPGENFIITYFSENSSLLDDYPKLNFRTVDIRFNVIPVTKIPRTKITPQIIKSFKKLGILSYSSTMKVPVSKNIFYDLSIYFNAIDSTFNPSNYRQRLSIFIKNITNQSFNDYKDFSKVLMYSIDLTKEDLNKFIDRKFFPILQQLKDQEFNFDHLILCLITPKGVRYRLLVKDKQFKLQKIITILKSIKSGGYSSENEINEIEDEEIEIVANKVMDQIDSKINPSNKEKVKDAVKTFLQKDQISKEKVLSDKINQKNIEKIAVASILNKVSGDINKAKKITNSISKKKL